MTPGAPPEARLRLGDCDIRLLGTIAGFVPDAARVEHAFADHKPDRVALGIPPEDMAALRKLAAAPVPSALIGKPQEPPPTRRRLLDPGAGAQGLDITHPHPSPLPGSGPPTADELGEPPIAGLDAASMRLLQLLGRFGPTRLPSPDLEAAYRLAHEAGVPLVAIDVDDVAHAEAFTQFMGVRHIILSNQREKRLLRKEFADVADAYGLAAAWDQEQAAGPLAKLERLRERHMAVRLRELAARSTRLLGILPAARLSGIAADVQEGI